MTAIVDDRQGGPEVVRVEQVVRPSPRDGEVLVRVYAASVNSWDRDLLRGWRLASRLRGPLKPRFRVLRSDIAGRVEQVGRKDGGPPG